MADQKIIAILGATGAQGGGVVKAILNDTSGEFKIRGITRNTSSENATALAEKGVELVQADLDNYESLLNAFKDVYGVFAVTNFWEHFSPEKEMEQAEAIARAASESDVKHLVWSTLEDTRKLVPLSDNRMPTLMEKYKVPHFDAKGESNKYFEEYNVPTTNLLTSFYWDNLIHFGMGPQRGEKGELTFAIPMADKKLPGIAAVDIGKCAFGIFKAGDKFIGKTVGISGEHLTGQEMADDLSATLSETVNYFPVPFDMYRGFEFPGAEDLGNMFQYKHDFNSQFCDARNIGFSKELNSELLSFKEWLSKYKDQIKID